MSQKLGVPQPETGGKLHPISVPEATGYSHHNNSSTAARTGTLAIFRNLFNFKVICQRSRSQDRIFGFCTVARWGKKFVSRITEKVTDGFA